MLTQIYQSKQLHPSCDVEQDKEIESTSFPCTTQGVCKHLSYNVLRNAFNFSCAILSNEEYKINEEVSSWTGTLIVSARRPCYRPAIVTSSKTAIISLKIRQRRPPLRSSLRAASLSQEIRDQWYRDVERDQKVEDKKAG